MKNRITILAMCFLSYQGYTQDIVMKQSNEFDSPARHDILAPIQLGEQGIFQFNVKSGRGKSESVHVVHFNNKLEKLQEKTITLDDEWMMISEIPHVVRVKNKIYFLTREDSKKTEGMSAIEFDPQTLTFSKNKIPLFQSSDKVYNWSFFRFGQEEADECLVSENNTRIGLIYRLKPESRREKVNYDIIGMNVFDENMQKVWTREYKMPYTEAVMDNESYAVTNDGKIYLLAKVNLDKEDRVKGEAKYNYELLVYDGQHEQPDVIKIDLDKIIPSSFNLFETKTGEMMLSGFYSRLNQTGIDGAYVLQIDEQGKTLKFKNGGMFEIPTEIIKANATARELRKMKRAERKDDENDLGVKNLVIRYFTQLDNGDMILMGEEYEVQMRTYTTGVGANATTRTEYKTFANDIYVIRANKDGTSWVRKIPKYQRSNDAYGRQLSFNAIVSGNDVYVLYTDNKKNKSLSEKEVPEVHIQGYGGYLACVKLDQHGTISKKYLTEIEDFETNFYIRRFVQGDHGNIIYTARKLRRNSIISLEVQ
ncbi:MAG: hypothetical protein JNM95_02030 [Chitinophagaceae bacterium]|nr:hypothetical protein [Chitinophagaceae bacterium]